MWCIVHKYDPFYDPEVIGPFPNEDSAGDFAAEKCAGAWSIRQMSAPDNYPE